jgi:hypothetical protein
MQHAQPVSLAHHLMAYFWMFDRDHGRVADTRKRLNTLPLGSAALAGTGFPLDRGVFIRQKPDGVAAALPLFAAAGAALKRLRGGGRAGHATTAPSEAEGVETGTVSTCRQWRHWGMQWGALPPLPS